MAYVYNELYKNEPRTVRRLNQMSTKRLKQTSRVLSTISQNVLQP